MQGYISSPLMFMILVNLLLLIVGCLMTTGEAILVLAPLLAPLAESYGYNKVLFGLIMILNLEIGYLTPPVGLNLIVAMSAFKQSFGLLCQRRHPLHRHHAGVPGDRHLAAVDRHVLRDGEVLAPLPAHAPVSEALGAPGDVVVDGVGDDAALALPQVLTGLPIVGVLDHHAQGFNHVSDTPAAKK